MKSELRELLELADALESSQQQCDEDGQMIAVSRQAVHEAIAALRSHAAALASEWVMVPREPTEAMLAAACKTPWSIVEPAMRAELYRAMIAAAPPAPTQTGT